MRLEKKLLQEADSSLQKCVDTCRAAEKTATQMKFMNLQDKVHALNKTSRKPPTANAPQKEPIKGEKPRHAEGKPHHAVEKPSKENLLWLLWISASKREGIRQSVYKLW